MHNNKCPLHCRKPVRCSPNQNATILNYCFGKCTDPIQLVVISFRLDLKRGRINKATKSIWPNGQPKRGGASLKSLESPNGRSPSRTCWINKVLPTYKER